MPIKCAFCTKPANSGEHLWSAWICALFEGTEVLFRKQFATDTNVATWKAIGFDKKANVLCRQCNMTWMSDLEGAAKSCMQGMILSADRTEITPACIVTMASYAFKAAVIGDHMQRKKKPFFSFEARRHFRRSLSLPPGIQVWVGCISELDPHHAIYRMKYGYTSPKISHGYYLYTFTWGVGRLVIQLAALKTKSTRFRRDTPPPFAGHKFWDQYAIPIWPSDGSTVAWPPQQHLSYSLLDK